VANAQWDRDGAPQCLMDPEGWAESGYGRENSKVVLKVAVTMARKQGSCDVTEIIYSIEITR